MIVFRLKKWTALSVLKRQACVLNGYSYSVNRTVPFCSVEEETERQNSEWFCYTSVNGVLDNAVNVPKQAPLAIWLKPRTCRQ